MSASGNNPQRADGTLPPMVRRCQAIVSTSEPHHRCGRPGIERVDGYLLCGTHAKAVRRRMFPVLLYTGKYAGGPTCMDRRYLLFALMAERHKIVLMDEEIQEIIDVVKEIESSNVGGERTACQKGNDEHT